MLKTLSLKIAIIERFGSQVEASKKLGIREARLSYLIRGHSKPSAQELKVLKRGLGKDAIVSAFGSAQEPEALTQAAS